MSPHGRRQNALPTSPLWFPLLVVLLSFLWALPSSASSDSRPADKAVQLDRSAALLEESDPGDLAVMAERRHMSLATAERAMRLESATLGLEELINARWTDSFAGMWLSIDSEPGLFVAFTNSDRSRNGILADAFGYPDDIHFLVADHSLAELQDLQLQLRDARASMQSGARLGIQAIDDTKGQFDLDIDVRANRVVVRVERRTDSIATAFIGVYGREWIEVREGITHFQCLPTDCYDNMMSGLQYGDAGGPWCTTAFSAGLSSNWSQKLFLTAAHCTDPNPARYHAGHYFGAYYGAAFGGRTDAARVLKDAVWDMKARMWISASVRRSVCCYITWSNIQVGVQVVKGGGFSGTQYGDILGKYYMPSGVPDSERFVLASYCANPGDSGSGIMHSQTAYGIHHGADDVGPNTSCPTPENSVFGAINYAMDALDVDLMGE